jgi:peptide/nickel transport system substrate-binding protein
VIAALAATVFLGLAGCGGNSAKPAASASPIEGGDIKVAWNTQPVTLDPAMTTSTVTRDIDAVMLERVVDYDKNSKPQPVLCSSYDINKDYTQFTFHLRKGVKFQNGQEMTSADVKASWQYAFSKVALLKTFFSGAAIQTPDSYTVVLELPKTLYPTLDLLSSSGPYVLPASSIESAGTTGIPNDKIIGTGPFKFVEWKQDQYIKVAKYADYKSPSGKTSALAGERKAYANSLQFNFVTDETTRLNGVKSGDYDLAITVNQDNMAMVKSDTTLQYDLLQSMFVGMVYNKSAGITANQKFRQAVNAVLDSDAILKATYAKEAFSLNGSIVSEKSPYHTTDDLAGHYNVHDLDKAKQLLKESGYNGETIRFITTKDYAYNYNSAVVVQQQLKKIGVKVDLQVSDWATLLQKRADPSAWDLFITAFNYTVPSGLYFFTPGWAGSTNSPELANAMNEFNASTTSDEAKSATKDIQKAMYDYVPASIYGTAPVLNVWSKSIGGYSSLEGPILYGLYKTAS